MAMMRRGSIDQFDTRGFLEFKQENGLAPVSGRAAFASGGGKEKWARMFFLFSAVERKISYFTDESMKVQKGTATVIACKEIEDRMLKKHNRFNIKVLEHDAVDAPLRTGDEEDGSATLRVFTQAFEDKQKWTRALQMGVQNRNITLKQQHHDEEEQLRRADFNSRDKAIGAKPTHDAENGAAATLQASFRGFKGRSAASRLKEERLEQQEHQAVFSDLKGAKAEIQRLNQLLRLAEEDMENDAADAAPVKELEMARSAESKAESTKKFTQTFGYCWDVVIVFKVPEQDVAIAAANKGQLPPVPKDVHNTLALLDNAGLEVATFFSKHLDEVYCKIRAPSRRLELEADRVDYKLRLNKFKLQAVCAKGLPASNIKPIVLTNEHMPKKDAVDPYAHVFTKYQTEPEFDYLQDMFTFYGEGATPMLFRGVDRIKLILSIMKAHRVNGGCGIDIDAKLKDKEFDAVFPLHDRKEKAALDRDWLIAKALPEDQPFSDIKDYLGEKIGLYFAWLGHYTVFLCISAVFGVIVTIYMSVKTQNNPDTVLLPWFGLVMCLWSTCFAESWKRRNAQLAMEWGMTGYEEEEQDRPQFEGETIPSPVTGESITFFKPFEKMRRMFLGLCVTMTLLICVIGVVAGIYLFRYWSSEGHAGFSIFKGTGPLIASLLNFVQITVLNEAYQGVAYKLTDWENHRTDTQHEDNLIGKNFCFKFINSFGSMFYIAFIKEAVGDPCPTNESNPHGGCMAQLQLALKTIFISRLLVGNCQEVVIPWVKHKMALKKEQPASIAEEEFTLGLYGDKQLFLDYDEMILQFGYASLFVTAFPLAPLLAAANNYVEIRVDGFKLMRASRRPIPKGAEDIGTWAHIVEIMGTAAVITNGLIMCFTAKATIGDWPAYNKLALFVAIEHIVLFSKYLLGLWIPDESHSTRTQLDRANYLVHKIVNRVADDDANGAEAPLGADMPKIARHSSDAKPLRSVVTKGGPPTSNPITRTPTTETATV